MTFEQLIFSLLVAVLTAGPAYFMIASQRRKNVSASTLDMAQVNELVQKQYAQLIALKDHRVDELETRVELFEAQLKSYRNEVILYKQYINYLLDGIECDKKSTFKPLDLDHFGSDGMAKF